MKVSDTAHPLGQPTSRPNDTTPHSLQNAVSDLGSTMMKLPSNRMEIAQNAANFQLEALDKGSDAFVRNIRSIHSVLNHQGKGKEPLSETQLEQLAYIDTYSHHVTNLAITKTQALIYLKKNDFQHAQNPELSIRLSATALGGGKTEAQERAERFAQLGQTIVKKQQQIAIHEAAIKIIDKKHSEFHSRLQDVEHNGPDYKGFLAAINECDKQMLDLEEKIKQLENDIKSLRNANQASGSGT